MHQYDGLKTHDHTQNRHTPSTTEYLHKAVERRCDQKSPDTFDVTHLLYDQNSPDTFDVTHFVKYIKKYLCKLIFHLIFYRKGFINMEQQLVERHQI